MYFLHVVIIYLFGCLCVAFLYAFRSNRYIHVAISPLILLKRILFALFPASLRSLSVRLIDWLVFERNCVYQVTYVFLVITSHYLLIRDVITPLYRYSDSENHLFFTLACLFCSGLCYTAVCVTDPGRRFSFGYVCGTLFCNEYHRSHFGDCMEQFTISASCFSFY
ncbi:hypothetical protein EG68_06149 [Paragonimus skrjabini miyazakii]|uniref:Uncharacterized protein n=1 Tax=Paragonimus skrjabini miyazakii TaxID=59628 RepID=A0A8S9YT85_9TREM|nr:hypothetical protein EG68_06149 [Paragonimus skrjabini miyazakii]